MWRSDGRTVRVARWAHQLAGGNVTLMLDCDDEGQQGTVQALAELAPHCRVRLAWSPTTHGGKFRGRQPESLSADDWKLIAESLAVGAVGRQP